METKGNHTNTLLKWDKNSGAYTALNFSCQWDTLIFLSPLPSFLHCTTKAWVISMCNGISNQASAKHGLLCFTGFVYFSTVQSHNRLFHGQIGGIGYANSCMIGQENDPSRLLYCTDPLCKHLDGIINVMYGLYMHWPPSTFAYVHRIFRAWQINEINNNDGINNRLMELCKLGSGLIQINRD